VYAFFKFLITVYKQIQILEMRQNKIKGV